MAAQRRDSYCRRQPRICGRLPTGFSTIGRLITAEATPSTIETHQIDVVGAGALEQQAAEPDAEEAADLVACDLADRAGAQRPRSVTSVPGTHRRRRVRPKQECWPLWRRPGAGL